MQQCWMGLELDWSFRFANTRFLHVAYVVLGGYTTVSQVRLRSPIAAQGRRIRYTAIWLLGCWVFAQWREANPRTRTWLKVESADDGSPRFSYCMALGLAMWSLVDKLRRVAFARFGSDMHGVNTLHARSGPVS